MINTKQFFTDRDPRLCRRNNCKVSARGSCTGRRTCLYNRGFPTSRERPAQASTSSQATSRNRAYHSANSTWQDQQLCLITETRISMPKVKRTTRRITGIRWQIQAGFTYLHLLAERLLFSPRKTSCWSHRGAVVCWRLNDNVDLLLLILR